MDSLNTTVKSKNSHRNRLLMLLVDKQVEEEATTLVDTSHLMNTMMDEDDQFDDEYDDYEQIMKSNFSMCTSTFANFCDSSGSGAGPGGGGGGSSSPVEAKRKRVDPITTATATKLVAIENDTDMDVDYGNNVKSAACSCHHHKHSDPNEAMSHEVDFVRNELLKLGNQHCYSKPTQCKSCNNNNSISNIENQNSGICTENSTRSQSPQFYNHSSSSSSATSNTSTRSTSPTSLAAQQQRRRHSPADLLAIRFQIDLNQPVNHPTDIMPPSSSINFSSNFSSSSSYPSANNHHHHHHQAASSSNSNTDLNNNELMLLKPINNLLKYSLSNKLHLMRKDTLLFLIESNLRANLRSPFDLFAYDRLKRSNRVVPESSAKFDYNLASVRRLSRMIEKRFNAATGDAAAAAAPIMYNPLDPFVLKSNGLLPNSMATFLMPFYFDIFKVTELGSFSQEHVQLMLALKRSFKAQLYLNYDALVAYLRENILWNCFILFKYRHVQSAAASMGFFNFYLSFVHILVHLEQVIDYLQQSSLSPSPQANHILKEHIRHAIGLSNVLPHLLDTLILTGVFKHGHYVRFKKFVYSRYPPSMTSSSSNHHHHHHHQQPSSLTRTRNQIEAAYYERALKSIEARLSCITSPSTLSSSSYSSYLSDNPTGGNIYNTSSSSSNSGGGGGVFPMKLTALCRLKVKQCMREYSPSAVEKLNIPKSTKTYLLYDNEINEFFLSQQNHHHHYQQ